MMSLIIEKVTEGGFLVIAGGGHLDHPGRFGAALFAASTIEEALDFIKNKMSS